MLFGTLLSVLAFTASFTKGAASKEFNVVQRRSLASTRSTPVGSKDLLGGFQTCQTKIDQHISTFGGYCETSNINAILRGLNEVRKSMVNLGSQCGSAYNLDKTSATGLSVNYIQILTKLEVLFKILDKYNFIPRCEATLHGFSVPLNLFVSFFKNSGIDVEAECRERGFDIDVAFFTKIGIRINLDLSATVSALVGLNL